MRRTTDLERTFADGDLIVAQGDTSTEMFIVAEGRVRIEKPGPRGPTVLGHVERGEFFGEMALLESLPRDADTHAVGATRVIVIASGSLLLRFRRDPSLAIEMLQRLSGRLRQSNTRVMELLGDAAEVTETAWELPAHPAPPTSAEHAG